MSTYDRPSPFVEMIRTSSDPWVLLGDERGVVRAIPYNEPVKHRELVVRGYMVPDVHFRDGGQYEYRASRAEAEWRADIELDRRRGAPRMEPYPKPLGTFIPRRRHVMGESEILAMFGEAAA